jgi:hypothetical protein
MEPLIDFLDADLIPELDALDQAISSGDKPRAAMHRLFLTDAFLWLHLGAEIGIFPLDAAEECLDGYLRPFFESLASPETSERSESPASYANHSEESWNLVKAFPHFAGILIEKAMRGDRDLLSAEQNRFTYARGLVSTFQSLQLLSDYLRSHTTRTFITAVNFLDPDDWNSIWKVRCSPEEVEESERPEFKGLSKATIFAGYLRLYRYGLQAKDLFESLTDDPRLDAADLAKVRDRVHEMLGWLVNLSSKVTSDRLALVQTEVVEALEEQAGDDPNVSFALVASIQKSMEESLAFIGLPFWVLEPRR